MQECRRFSFCLHVHPCDVRHHMDVTHPFLKGFEMKVLVIPDVHLKPWMFDRASELMKSEKADQAVCLTDIPDDWNQELNLDLYFGVYGV